MSDDGLLAEQREFYRARAPEYDEWCSGAVATTEVRSWPRNGIGKSRRSPLHLTVSAQPVASLEMAGGTGWWTQHLARTAGHLTVLDASPETLDLNRDRVGRPDVERRGRPVHVAAAEDLRSCLLLLLASHVPR